MRTIGSFTLFLLLNFFLMSIYIFVTGSHPKEMDELPLLVSLTVSFLVVYKKIHSSKMTRLKIWLINLIVFLAIGCTIIFQNWYSYNRLRVARTEIKYADYSSISKSCKPDQFNDFYQCFLDLNSIYLSKNYESHIYLISKFVEFSAENKEQLKYGDDNLNKIITMYEFRNFMTLASEEFDKLLQLKEKDICGPLGKEACQKTIVKSKEKYIDLINKANKSIYTLSKLVDKKKIPTYLYNK